MKKRFLTLLGLSTVNGLQNFDDTGQKYQLPVQYMEVLNKESISLFNAINEDVWLPLPQRMSMLVILLMTHIQLIPNVVITNRKY
jgi:hypothetical protein